MRLNIGGRLPPRPPNASGRCTRPMWSAPSSKSVYQADGGRAMTGVSFVVPVHNGAAHLAETLASIAAQADGRPMEIIVVEDGSHDDSAALLRVSGRALPTDRRRRSGSWRRRGRECRHHARLASNRLPGRSGCGARARVDGDACGRARRSHGSRGTRELRRPTPTHRSLRESWDSTSNSGTQSLGVHTDHVCTGNTAYRLSALHAIGLLDESLGYGYDNDLSYRLQATGYRLAFCRAARSRHRWREGLAGYLAQQYGFGYGRLDVVARHPEPLYGRRRVARADDGAPARDGRSIVSADCRRGVSGMASAADVRTRRRRPDAARDARGIERSDRRRTRLEAVRR